MSLLYALAPLLKFHLVHVDGFQALFLKQVLRPYDLEERALLAYCLVPRVSKHRGQVAPTKSLAVPKSEGLV